jgi:hypothetical protein
MTRGRSNDRCRIIGHEVLSGNDRADPAMKAWCVVADRRFLYLPLPAAAWPSRRRSTDGSSNTAPEPAMASWRSLWSRPSRRTRGSAETAKPIGNEKKTQSGGQAQELYFAGAPRKELAERARIAFIESRPPPRAMFNDQLPRPRNGLSYYRPARAAATALGSVGTRPFSPPGYGCLYCAVPDIQELTAKATRPVLSWRYSRYSEWLAEGHDRPR